MANEFVARKGLIVSGSTLVTGSLNVTRGITGSLLGTSSWANNSTSSSFAVTASFALNAGSGGGAAFPFNGAAVITGSLLVTGSGLRVTGSADVLGNFTATSKSFKIDHQRLPGKKLIYGVLEGPEHGVYVRGRLQSGLTQIATIRLPDEWEWLVDENSITVQLTSVGKIQNIYVHSIEQRVITVMADAIFECFYLVQATRKDVPELTTVE